MNENVQKMVLAENKWKKIYLSWLREKMSMMNLISPTVSIFHKNINNKLLKILLVFTQFTFNSNSQYLLLITVLRTPDFVWAAMCPTPKDKS